MVVPLVPAGLQQRRNQAETVVGDGLEADMANVKAKDKNHNDVEVAIPRPLVKTLSCNIPYKDVVVIGNGPSGIVLSYFLAGNWPYYNGLGESTNEMLHYRLLAAGMIVNNRGAPTGKFKPLVEQDLSFLSQGLEGRSSNPVALLFDALNHPQADLGLELPSLLNWEYHPEKEIDHVVIGRGPPGGAWQSMDGNVLTISLGCWMELPGLNFRQWEAKQNHRVDHESRASVASVAQYYCDYVESNDLSKYFLSNSVITEVRRVSCPPSKNCTLLEPLKECCDTVILKDKLRKPTPLPTRNDREEARFCRRHTISEIPFNYSSRRPVGKRKETLWRVTGYTRIPGDNDTTIHRPFAYLTPNLVLATGASDKPNALNIPGEELSFVFHSLNELEHLIRSGYLNAASDPVLVVGAGLSAADAIIAALLHSIPVIHVFRRSSDDPELIFRQLPANMYPEYHKVYQMMHCPPGYENYKPYEQHIVTKIKADHTVYITGPDSCGIIKVSSVAICIGNKPELSFLGGIENNLGVYPHMPVDCKRNPVAINLVSHESVSERGLYAMGPIVGENFVRFLQGGALAITSNLVQSQGKHKATSFH